MDAESHFSSAIRLTNLDDYLTPSQACVKPNIIEKNPAKKARIEVRKDGTYLEVNDGGSTVLESAKITLNDCLACSGCITSAESVLITAQSTSEFLTHLNTGKVIVVSLSPQSRASLATHFKLSPLQTLKKLITFLKKIGVSYVFDTAFSREFALLESAAEFVARYRKQYDAPLPMLASACPGWICYAEKSHGEWVLPYISTTKSPQQIMGTIVKQYFAKMKNISGDQIYHASVMPCYDKKLEASRDDFYNDILKTRDVDCVLTSGEILELINKENVNFVELEESPIESLFTNISAEEQLFGVPGSSGGYLEFIFRYAAKELFGVVVDKIEYKTARSADFRTTTLEVDGKPVLTFANAYGFKNIQNVIMKMKRGAKPPWDFVEIMACPSGCINGGGQIKPQPGENQRELVKRVEATYNQQLVRSPLEDTTVQALYKQWFDSVFSPDARTSLHTQYHAREKVLNPLATVW